jgi:hypothetical protein
MEARGLHIFVPLTATVLVRKHVIRLEITVFAWFAQFLHQSCDSVDSNCSGENKRKHGDLFVFGFPSF